MFIFNFIISEVVIFEVSVCGILNSIFIHFIVLPYEKKKISLANCLFKEKTMQQL